jgi:hypothetical protein
MNRCLEMLKNYLDREGYSPRCDEEETCMRFFVVTNELTLRVVVMANEDWISVRTFLPFKVPKAKRALVSRLQAYFNWRFRNGTFSLDFNDGETAVSVGAPSVEDNLEGKALEAQFDALMKMTFLLMGDSRELISRVAFGSLSAKQAIIIHTATRNEYDEIKRVPEELLDTESMMCN